MKRRRVFLFAALFAVPLTVVAAACTFPDVSFSAGGSEAGSGIDAADGGPTADAANTDAEEVPIVLPDGNVIGDVIERDDASAIVDAAGCDGKCDCDNDGYLRIGCDAATELDEPGAGSLGGGDCVDIDPLVHPNINTFVLTEPTPPNVGDWNCDNNVERSIKIHGSCSGLNNGLVPCSGVPGEKVQSACGTRTDFYTCVGTGPATCGVVFLEQRVQTCK
ncbi:MAG: hypothetical protein KIT84_05830 [Labilithrix sp.]|nr:hypothetical protein [Labilithrix sp.]MCW5810509.1 hypothetical protein [Labilithrix sp.]